MPSANSSQDKENAPPTADTTDTPTNTSPALPPLLQSLHDAIFSTLKSLFSAKPPHTIQRLAELLLDPKEHYRSLAAYLHALDRVVHVTSGAHTFPLPPAIPDPSSLSVLANGAGAGNIKAESVSWGNPAPPGASSAAAAGLGSDESLGGALLTPISWLSSPRSAGGSRSPLEGAETVKTKTESTEMIEGPNGPGGIETVSVSMNGVSSATTAAGPESDVASLRAEGGITQGELLRQEQKAGVVPATQLGNNKGGSDGLGEDDEMPHARGPEEIGMEDMGPQNGTERAAGAVMRGIDIEAAVGRKIEAVENDDEVDVRREEGSEAPGTPKREADVEMGGEEKKVKIGEDAKTETETKTGAGTKTETETEVEVKTKSETKSDGDGDGDAEIVDADGKATDEPKVGEKGETKGADIVDSTTQV